MNNCETCEHRQHPDGGWCYMFRVEPAGRCMQHTALRGPTTYKIPAAVDLDKLGLSPEWRKVADALQRYGAEVLPYDLRQSRP